MTDWQMIKGIIEKGHQVASGLSPHSPYPQGTIELQTPFFQALGLDISMFFPGTLNVSLLPHTYHLKNPQYTFVRGDICDRAVVTQAMNDIDTVVHFAAETHVDRSIMDSSEFVKTNVVGTQVLLDVAKEKNIKHFQNRSL
jgi:hypothetical protein